MGHNHIRQIDFKSKTVKRDKEGHYIRLKGSINQEDITIKKIYAPNSRAPKYMKETLAEVKGKIESNTIILGYFNTSL